MAVNSACHPGTHNRVSRDDTRRYVDASFGILSFETEMAGDDGQLFGKLATRSIIAEEQHCSHQNGAECKHAQTHPVIPMLFSIQQAYREYGSTYLGERW